MSVVPENAPTVMAVGSKFWAFTWFFPTGVRPLRGTSGAGGDNAPLRIKDYTITNCEAPYNWPTISVADSLEVQGMAWQLEICPTTGREHVQGYIEMHKTTRFQRLQSILNMPGANCGIREKTREACVRYVTKEDTRMAGTFPVLLGTLAEQDPANYKSRQGKRTDISGMVDLIKSGKRAIDQLESDPDTFVKYARGMMEVRRVVQQHAARAIRANLHVTVYWGAPGTGKTRTVYDKHGVDNVFTLIADNSACWFDGYEGEDVLLIDDFKGWLTYSMLLKMLDIYPFRAPVKGSFTYARWTKVYITSNYSPTTWYSGDMDYGALKRRMHTIKEFGAIHGVMSAGAGGPSNLAEGFTLTRTDTIHKPETASHFVDYPYSGSDDDSDDASD